MKNAFFDAAFFDAMRRVIKKHRDVTVWVYHTKNGGFRISTKDRGLENLAAVVTPEDHSCYKDSVLFSEIHLAMHCEIEKWYFSPEQDRYKNVSTILVNGDRVRFSERMANTSTSTSLFTDATLVAVGTAKDLKPLYDVND